MKMLMTMPVLMLFVLMMNDGERAAAARSGLLANDGKMIHMGSIYDSIYLSYYLSVFLSIYLSTYLHLHLHVCDKVMWGVV